MSNKVAANPTDYVDGYNSLIFIINTIINNKIRTAELVRVISNNGDGTVDVLPIISDIDNKGNAIEQSSVFNVKFFEWQYGINSIKAEPAINDIGLVIVCTKDTQNVISGIVGSSEKFSLQSGIYIGGIKGLNQEPTQFVEFTENGINITTPKTLTVNATENIVLNATKDVTINATKNVTVNSTEDTTINAVNAKINASAQADVIAPTVNLGGSGGVAVAKDGDEVVMGSTVVGTIKASSTVVKTI